LNYDRTRLNTKNQKFADRVTLLEGEIKSWDKKCKNLYDKIDPLPGRSFKS